jgi:hypothetical protein
MVTMWWRAKRLSGCNNYEDFLYTHIKTRATVHLSRKFLGKDGLRNEYRYRVAVATRDGAVKEVREASSKEKARLLVDDFLCDARLCEGRELW